MSPLGKRSRDLTIVLYQDQEIEVHEKMERATRLAVRYNNPSSGTVTPERTRKLHRTFTDGPFRSPNHQPLFKSESLQAMSRTWDESQMRSALKWGSIDGTNAGSTSSLPKELEKCSINDRDERLHEKHPKRRHRSAILVQRRREAEAKKSLRMERLQSLEKDCEKAKWIVYQIKALSMPSLRSESPNEGETESDHSLGSLMHGSHGDKES